MLDELRELASRVPFDERGNPDIKLEDISTLLLREYLPKGKMKNPHNFTEKNFKGSVPQLIKQTMEYLRTSVLYETVQKVSDRTICNRVKMLAYQDTYYSDNDQCQLYFQDSEIHGTVGFICGDGDVWFERCLLVTEKRTLDGSGRNVITFTLKDEENSVETILTADEAKRYTVKRAFPGWNPQKVIRQTEKKARKLMKRLQ